MSKDQKYFQSTKTETIIIVSAVLNKENKCQKHLARPNNSLCKGTVLTIEVKGYICGTGSTSCGPSLIKRTVFAM